MRGLYHLFSINVSGKIFSVFIFAALARVLETEHLAYLGFIPAFSSILLAALGFGVGNGQEIEISSLGRDLMIA